LCLGCIKEILAPHANREIRIQLKEAQELILAEDYETAFLKYREVRDLLPHTSPGDKALFQMGLIRVYPDNPKRDYKKSLLYFKQIISDYSKSRYKKDAQAWIKILSKFKQIKSTNLALRLKLKELTKTNNNLQEQLKKIKEIDIITEEKKRVR
jgi:outer membrane protein assembly factor BamD (BamD/ComL family)